MEWTGDTAAGDWIRKRLDDPWRGTMHDAVPRGFEAYVRVFHPASRDRPVGTAWPPVPYARHHREWEAFQRSDPQIDTERVSWAKTAGAFGSTMHAQAQWSRLIRINPDAPHEDGPRDAAGWRYADPQPGKLDADLISGIAEHLAEHTRTPDSGLAAVWAGWGGLLGFYGEMPSRTFLQFAGDAADDSRDNGSDPAHTDPALQQHNRMLGRSIHDRFNSGFRKPTWQPGILSDEISRGERLRLPGREHILFRAGATEFADPDWVLHAPWRDRESERHGFEPDAESPSLLWPDDHAWVMVTEVDYDSTIVGGRAELIRALRADSRLEAIPVTAGTDLTSESDGVNP